MNHHRIKVELEIAAEQILHQFAMTNEQIGEQLKNGIQKAIDGFDFEKEVEYQTQNAIKAAIKESMDYGKLKDLIRKKSEAILDSFVEKELERYNNLKS